jgi:hypothetical protein
MPRLSLLLVVVALLGAIVGATYALRFDPELAFWTEAAKRKLNWVDEMRAKHGHVIGVVGGSTTTFAIDAQTLEKEHGLPVANLGLHAGMGPEACVGFGFAALERGDTMILSLEPTMISDGIDTTAMGTRFAYGLGKLELLYWRRTSSLVDLVSSFFQLQPGGYHVVTMLGKLALGQPLYRYSVDQMRPGGLQITSEKRSLAVPQNDSKTPQEYRLPEDGRRFLENTKAEAKRRGIKVAYLLPWSYAPAELSETLRSANRKLISEVNEILPVIFEFNVGIHTNKADFADTSQHLNEKAAARRSLSLVPALQSLQRGLKQESP